MGATSTAPQRATGISPQRCVMSRSYAPLPTRVAQIRSYADGVAVQRRVPRDLYELAQVFY